MVREQGIDTLDAYLTILADHLRDHGFCVIPRECVGGHPEEVHAASRLTTGTNAAKPHRGPSAPAAGIGERVAALDWAAIAASLDAHGCATTGPLLSPAECASLADTYVLDEPFRSRVVMARHGFGRGEYKYFAYPLPETVAALRTALYPPLAAIANRWNEAMGIAVRYPGESRRLPQALPRRRDRRSRRRCCCNTARATTTACTRTSTASTCFRCRSPSCFTAGR